MPLPLLRAASPLLVTGLGLMVLTSAVVAADRPAASTAPPATVNANAMGDTVLEEVTDRVRVQTTATLRSDRGGALFTGVTVENTSDQPLTGRLVLVVDDTGVPGLESSSRTGQLDSGEAYLEVLPLNGELQPKGKTSATRIEFASGQPLTAAARKDFSLTARIFRIGPPAPVAALEPNGPREKEYYENLPGKNYSQARLDQVLKIQERHTPALRQHEGVYGTGVGEDEQGNLVVKVFTQRLGIIKNLPGQVEGVPLDQRVTGDRFRAGPAWTRVIDINGRKHALGTPQQNKIEPIAEGSPAGHALPQASSTPSAQPPTANTPIPTDPTAQFTRPVPIGVSAFNYSDTACAAGTLGCRVVLSDRQLGMLSNSHVFAREGIAAAQKEDLPLLVTGDQIAQPGCLDAGSDIASDIIGTLVDFQPFSLTGLNTMDAAVVRINKPNQNLVLACTPSDGYGFPSNTPKPAYPGLRVKKYGRTTGYREGAVEAINVTATVSYSSGLIDFVGQVVVYGDHLTFGAPGDSGSLVVTETGNHPVALLFGGSGFQVLCNPIQPILERFNIAIDDGSETPPLPTSPNGVTAGSGSTMSGRMGQSAGTVHPATTP